MGLIHIMRYTNHMIAQASRRKTCASMYHVPRLSSGPRQPKWKTSPMAGTQFCRRRLAYSRKGIQLDPPEPGRSPVEARNRDHGVGPKHRSLRTRREWVGSLSHPKGSLTRLYGRRLLGIQASRGHSLRVTSGWGTNRGSIESWHD